MVYRFNLCSPTVSHITHIFLTHPLSHILLTHRHNHCLTRYLTYPLTHCPIHCPTLCPGTHTSATALGSCGAFDPLTKPDLATGAHVWA